MTTTRISALITALALLFSLSSPPRAEAISEGVEITLYVVGGIVLFVGAVVVGTIMTRDESKLMLVEPPGSVERDRDGVAFGLDCAQPDGTPALVCW